MSTPQPANINEAILIKDPLITESNRSIIASHNTQHGLQYREQLPLQLQMLTSSGVT